MASKSRIPVATIRKYYQEEIEAAIRQMKIRGGTLDDCIAELNNTSRLCPIPSERLKRCLEKSSEGYCLRTLDPCLW
jgi:hypothetical protein